MKALVKMQQALNVPADGLWGRQSQEALLSSGKRLKYIHGRLPAHFGRLRQSQVNGFDAVLRACNEHRGDAINPAYVAYILATAWHETAHTMQPIEEYGKGKGRKYGQRIDVNGSRYSASLPIYYGRGYVQLTWLSNYVLMRDLLGVDFVNKPELALEPEHASNIMLRGMIGGCFTGKTLGHYIRYGQREEYVKARRIINGTDKANLIAGYAVKFLECLELE